MNQSLHHLEVNIVVNQSLHQPERAVRAGGFLDLFFTATSGLLRVAESALVVFFWIALFLFLFSGVPPTSADASGRTAEPDSYSIIQEHSITRFSRSVSKQGRADIWSTWSFILIRLDSPLYLPQLVTCQPCTLLPARGRVFRPRLAALSLNLGTPGSAHRAPRLVHRYAAQTRRHTRWARWV